MEHSKTDVTAASSMDDEELSHECHQLLQSLPKGDFGGHPLYQYQGFWYLPFLIKPIISFQRHFQAQRTDIIVATKPKTGTTWLKALVFAVTKRTIYRDFQNHPLLTLNPHQLVPFFEFLLYAKNPRPDFTKMDTPRLFSTHIPYVSLPKSIKNSDCRIVYISRNPFDTFVSYYHFICSSWPNTAENISVERFLDMVCEGVEPYGPFFDHVLEYWKDSLERPEKVLFMKYEDLKEDIVPQLKKLAKFLGCPFSVEEEKNGVIEEITKLCSFENLRDLEVNKTGEFPSTNLKFKNKQLFRKGEVGDWVNYFTPSLMERFEKLMHEKLGDSGLTFKVAIEK